MKINISLLLIYLSLFPTTAKSDSVDKYLQCEMQKLKIPGLCVAIVKNGQLVKSKGYGLSNVELQSPATPKTIYQSGSIGKQFTAMLVMILSEKRTINLNEKVTNYLVGAPVTWKDITILNLLTHTSGLTRDIPEIDLQGNYTDEQLVKKIASKSLNFQPGTQWEYSNSGYVLLGIIIKKITGKSFEELLHFYIFLPLGMDTARGISDRDIIPNRAAGYDLVNGTLKNQTYVSPTFNSTADGALYFTILDLIKWDAALYSTKLLKKENMKLLWSPVVLKNGQTANYGLGWRLNNIKGQRIVEHGGNWQGFTTFISRYLDDKLTVIILTNLSGNVTHLGSMAHYIADIYNKELAHKGDQTNMDDSGNKCI